MLRRLFAVTIALTTATTIQGQWFQFGGNPGHTGSSTVPAQPLAHVLADVINDPFVPYEIQAGSGNLYAHYAGPLLDGDDVFMSFKAASIYGTTTWSVHRLHWENGQLVDKWTASVDWQPAPSYPGFWEPSFQSVITNGFVYAPAAGGTLL